LRDTHFREKVIEILMLNHLHSDSPEAFEPSVNCNFEQRNCPEENHPKVLSQLINQAKMPS
jgi:hypothetical protein